MRNILESIKAMWRALRRETLGPATVESDRGDFAHVGNHKPDYQCECC
jgi:hypothetical protein